MFPALEKILKDLKPKYDDDSIDRLNYAYTTTFLSLLIVIIGTKQYIGEPVQCWIPAEYKRSWEVYIENYCFVENTFFVEDTVTAILSPEEKKEREIIYYQWVPILLTGQLLLFLLPKAVWTALNWKTGFNVRAITRGGIKERHNKVLRYYKKNDTHENTKTIATHIMTVTALNSRRMDRLDKNNNPNIFGFRPSNIYASYTTTVYLVFKILNCINVVAQLFVMNAFLNTHYYFWGFGILQDLWNNITWKKSGRFPRVTYCEFTRRGDTNSVSTPRTAQCVLVSCFLLLILSLGLGILCTGEWQFVIE